MTIAAYKKAFRQTWSNDTPTANVRFVVLDTETTGLDPRRDKIISIGALAVIDGQMCLDDSFEVLLKVSPQQHVGDGARHNPRRSCGRNGRTRGAAAVSGLSARWVIVGHHIGHDIEVLNVACEKHFDLTLSNRSLDTMDLTLHLDDDGAFPGRPKDAGFSLDALCELFGVAPHDRHTAGGDTFLTALVFLRLLRAAKAVGRNTLGAISIPYPVSEEGN